jgi:hypothetical protein
MLLERGRAEMKKKCKGWLPRWVFQAESDDYVNSAGGWFRWKPCNCNTDANKTKNNQKILQLNLVHVKNVLKKVNQKLLAVGKTGNWY